MRLSRPKNQGSGEELLLPWASSLSVDVIACLLLLVVSSSAEVVAGGDDNTQTEKDRDCTEFDVLKRMHSSTQSLDDWRKDGFAFEDKRAAEFEALRANDTKMESANKLRRAHRRNTTPESFRTMFELRHEPAIIDGIPETDGWKAATWTIPSLAQDHPTMPVKVGVDDDNHDIVMNMADFARYTSTQKDDAPLYVFDNRVYDDEIGKQVMSEYQAPDLFTEDLFKLVAGDEQYPAHRWLLLGPKRSGSAVHYDPLGTSAWNTLISGRKLWFLAPPYMEDLVDSDKDAKNTACKWFIEVLPGLRARYEKDITVVVQHPGETMFVPAYWMHAVLNLDDAVAVTQNFVSTHNFPESWEETVRRLPDFAKRWLQELVVQREDLAMIALQVNAARRAQGLNDYGPGFIDEIEDDDDDFDYYEHDYDYFEEEL